MKKIKVIAPPAPQEQTDEQYAVVASYGKAMEARANQIRARLGSLFLEEISRPATDLPRVG